MRIANTVIEKAKKSLNIKSGDVTGAPKPASNPAPEEIKATIDLLENYLLYAVKDEYTTTVYKRHIQTGEQETIITFEEEIVADKGGNTWRGLPPSVALSNDKNFLAFIDHEGLKVYDLASGTTKTYIAKIGEGESLEYPPLWSFDTIKYAYSLVSPSFSGDGRYISFFETLWEGSAIGLMDIETESYASVKSITGGASRSHGIVWSAHGHVYADVSDGDGHSAASGLYVPAPNNIAKAIDISQHFIELESYGFRKVGISPDGSRLAFTYFGYQEESDYETLGIVNIDGSGFTVLAQAPDAIDEPIGHFFFELFFSSDGNDVFCVQPKDNMRELVRYSLAEGYSNSVLSLPSNYNVWKNLGWTAEGYLVMVGTSVSSNVVIDVDATRLFVFDINSKEIIFASSEFDQFTTFAGFSG